MDLNQIIEVIGKVVEIAGPHWPFLAVALILAIIGEVVKTIVFGKDDRKNLSGWKLVFHQTMILHPILAGALLGLVLGSVAPQAIATTGLIGTVLYFAFSGFASTGLYRMYKELSPVLISSMKAAIRTVFKRIGVSTPPPPPAITEEVVEEEEVSQEK
jgi:mannose/fructose/N-acetylgalactosamine-specific phosphotransferase system component IIC